MLVRFLGYVVGMIVVSAITIAFWIFQYHQPLQAEKRQIDAKHQELLAKQRKGKRLKQDIARLQQDIRARKAEIVTLLKEKTKNRDVGKFINDVEREAKNAGISLRSIRIMPKTQRQRFIEIPMEFGMEGTYIELYDFFHRLENLQMLNLTQSALNISGGGTGRGAKINDLENKIDKTKKLTDLEGKDVKIHKIDKNTVFPKLRINLNGGRIIIIDKSHIARFEDA